MATGVSCDFEQNISSDELKEIYCEHCEKSGESVIASSFCVVCLEFMCSVCESDHKRNNPKHILKYKGNMPHYSCSDKCKDHIGELLKLYCTTCRKIACPKCKNANHNKLCDLYFIPTLIETKDCKETKKDLQQTTTSFSNHLDDTKIQIKKNLGHTSRIANDANIAVQVRKEELISDVIMQKENFIDEYNLKKEKLLRQLEEKKEKLLRQLEEDHAHELQIIDQKQNVILKRINEDEMKILDEAKELEENNQIRLTSLEAITELLYSRTETIRQKINSGNTTAVVLLTAEQDINAIKKEYVEILRVNNVHEYVFMKANATIDNCNEFNILGSLIKSKSPSVKQNISAARCIDLQDENEKGVNQVSDLCMVSDVHLVAIGKQNTDNWIKLIDISNHRVIARASLSSSPKALTKISEGKAAFTQPDNNMIQFFSVSHSGEFDFTREISGLPFKGITYGHLCLYLTDDKKVFKLDLNNTDRAEPNINNFGQTVLSQPKCIVYNPKLKAIYVADGKHVVNMDFAGRVIHSRQMKDEIGSMAVGASNILYVGVKGLFSHTIYQITSNLTQVHELLKSSMLNVSCLCYSEKEHTLFCLEDDNIKAYKVD